MSFCCSLGTSTVVGDPHFMVTDPRSKEHFCFDYGGDDGEKLVLVDDAESGKEVESHMIDFGTNTVHKNLNYFNKWCLQETHTMESTAIT